MSKARDLEACVGNTPWHDHTHFCKDQNPFGTSTAHPSSPLLAGRESIRQNTHAADVILEGAVGESPAMEGPLSLPSGSDTAVSVRAVQPNDTSAQFVTMDANTTQEVLRLAAQMGFELTESDAQALMSSLGSMPGGMAGLLSQPPTSPAVLLPMSMGGAVMPGLGLSLTDQSMGLGQSQHLSQAGGAAAATASSTGMAGFEMGMLGGMGTFSPSSSMMNFSNLGNLGSLGPFSSQGLNSLGNFGGMDMDFGGMGIGLGNLGMGLSIGGMGGSAGVGGARTSGAGALKVSRKRVRTAPADATVTGLVNFSSTSATNAGAAVAPLAMSGAGEGSEGAEDAPAKKVAHKARRSSAPQSMMAVVGAMEPGHTGQTQRFVKAQFVGEVKRISRTAITVSSTTGLGVGMGMHVGEDGAVEDGAGTGTQLSVSSRAIGSTSQISVSGRANGSTSFSHVHSSAASSSLPNMSGVGEAWVASMKGVMSTNITSPSAGTLSTPAGDIDWSVGVVTIRAGHGIAVSHKLVMRQTAGSTDATGADAADTGHRVPVKDHCTAGEDGQPAAESITYDGTGRTASGYCNYSELFDKLEGFAKTPTERLLAAGVRVYTRLPCVLWTDPNRLVGEFYVVTAQLPPFFLQCGRHSSAQRNVKWKKSGSPQVRDVGESAQVMSQFSVGKAITSGVKAYSCRVSCVLRNGAYQGVFIVQVRDATRDGGPVSAHAEAALSRATSAGMGTSSAASGTVPGAASLELAMAMYDVSGGAGCGTMSSQAAATALTDDYLTSVLAGSLVGPTGLDVGSQGQGHGQAQSPLAGQDGGNGISADAVPPVTMGLDAGSADALTALLATFADGNIWAQLPDLAAQMGMSEEQLTALLQQALTTVSQASASATC